MFDAERLIKTYEMRIPAPPEQVFPLLCPTRERDWLPYWDYQMVYSNSGLAELEGVFTTDLPGRGNMTWVITRYEPPEKIQYTIFKHGSHVLNLSIRLAAVGSSDSLLTWQHVFTGLTEFGNRYICEYTEDQHYLHLAKIERCLMHFVTTGNMLDDD